MVVIKGALALPSLNKTSSSRTNSPVPSEGGAKRTTSSSILDALPRSRSKSGEGSKRVPSNDSSLPVLAPIAAAPAITASQSALLRPKLASLLSGRASPAQGSISPHQTPPGSAVGMHHPAITPVSTPAIGVIPSTPVVAGPSAISNLEASYVSKVGMGLSDAVNKVFPSTANFVAGAVGAHHGLHDAPIVYRGMCAPRADKAREVGQMMVTELHAAISDQYLLRSLLRSAILKTLSIFLSRLEPLAVTSQIDASLLTVAKSVKEAENPPVSQKFSFLVLRSAWELRKGLSKACVSPVNASGKLEEMPRFVRETLTPWITKLDLLTNKIWNPILAAIKEEAVDIVVRQGRDAGVSPLDVHVALHPPPVNSTRSLSLSRVSSSTAASTASQGLAAPGAIPLNATYLRDLSALLNAASRTFAWLSVADVDNQKWKVSIASAVIWKMLLVTSTKSVKNDFTLERRHSPPPGSPQPLAPSKTASQHAPASAKRSMSAMGMGRLRPSSAAGKRSPSPPAQHAEVASHSLIAELGAFEGIIERFISSLLAHPHPSAPLNSGNINEAPCTKGRDCNICNARYIPLDIEESDDEEALPREAMQEAMTALSSFVVVLRGFTVYHEPAKLILRAIQAVDDITLAPEICPNLIRALDTLPPLVLLQELVSRLPRYYGFRPPHELLNTSWKTYEHTMKGFHTGEEWVGDIGWELLKEIRRVREHLVAEECEHGEGSKTDEEGWLAMLSLAITELAEVDDIDEDGSGSNFTEG